MKITGQQIGEKDFARHATIIRKASEKLVDEKRLETVPTFFEQVTAIALNAFAEAKVELAILETGLGGRFDATTAAYAEIVGFAPIDLDHEQILGKSLAEIAAEKAAIIREDTRVIATPQKREAEFVIRNKCSDVGVEPFWAIPDVKVIENLRGGLPYLSFTTKKTNYKAVLKMLGKHQWTNAALAIYIAENLGDFNFNITKRSIESGLETAEHKGRLEFWTSENGVSVLFDGAHNVAGAKALKNYLDEFVKQPITLVFSAMKDKDLRAIAEILFPKAETLIFTKPDNPRSLETSELIKFTPENFSKTKVFQSATVEEALSIAKKISLNKNLICVTGSLYLVGEAQKLLNNKARI